MSDQTIEGKLIVTDRVGIGTERPETDTQLHILATNKDGKIYIESGGNLLRVAVTPSVASIGTTGNRPLQLQANANQGQFSGVYISENSKVGIKTTSPNFDLDIQGSINATQFNKNGQPWKITDDDIDDNTISGTKIKDKTITEAKLAFTLGSSQWVSSNNGSISYDSGNVGIGNPNPSFNLDVAGIINAKQFNKNGQPWKITDDDIDDNIISGRKIKPQSISQDKLDFAIGGSQWVSGNSGSISYDSGNVGIGNPNPSFKLDVTGIINAKQFNKNGQPWKITDEDIDDNVISGKKIQDKTITEAKLAFSITPGSSQWKSNQGSSNIYYNDGNVGIGTKNPQARLQVASGAIMPSAGKSNAGITFPKDAFGGGDAAWIRYYAEKGEAATLEIGVSNDPDARIALMSSGNIGINTINSQAILHIVAPKERFSHPAFGGEVKLFPTSGLGADFSYDGGEDSIFGFTNYGKENGETRFQWQGSDGKFRGLLTITNKGQIIGNIAAPSSRELKENITNFSTEEAIKALADLNPVKFNYRDDNDKKLKVGFIAEDVPEFVATSDRKALSALDIVAVLTKVIKEQQQELLLLKERVTSLEVV